MPYLEDLEDFDILFLQSKMYATNWVFLQYSQRDKDLLKKIHKDDYKQLKKRIEISLKDISRFEFEDNYKDQDSLRLIFEDFEKLLLSQREIMDLLQNFDDYQNPQNLLSAESLIEEAILPQTESLKIRLDACIAVNKSRTKLMSLRITDSLNTLTLFAPVLSLLTCLILVFSGFYVHIAVTVPVEMVKNNLEILSEGKIEELPTITLFEQTVRKMTDALDQLHEALKASAFFAQEIENGNFDAPFVARSPADRLGNALLAMKKSLKNYSQDMENQVAQRTEEVRKKELDLRAAYTELQASEEELKQYAEELLITNEQLDEQNRRINKQTTKIIDSIQYSKRIQLAIIPENKELEQTFGQNYFIFYQPKDIVSGDFYFFKKVHEKIIVAAIDCTGHGVSGAFVSIIGYTAMSHVLGKQKIAADQILNELHKEVRKMLRQEQNTVQDGMDMVLCVIDQTKKTVDFAGAMNPLFVIQNKELITLKADKRPIGGNFGGEERHFMAHQIDYSQHSCMLYLTTDGYQDQFGGSENRKFMPKRFRELLLEIHTENLSVQKEILSDTFEDWKNFYEQVDDVLVWGIRLA